MLLNLQLTTLLNDVLKQQARLRKGGVQLVYFCPECNHYKRKLEVCLEEGSKFGIYHCWTCGISGNLSKLLWLVKASQSYHDKLHDLTKDIKVMRRKAPDKSETEVSLPEEFHPLSKALPSIEYRNAMMYLKRRGVLREDIIRYNIGYCESGDYAYHVIVPSYDANGDLNFFMGRRYYESEGTIPHKKPQVSMDLVGFESFVNYKEPLNLCEGVFDAMAIRNNAIPLFGKYPSKKLREKMNFYHVKRVNMVLDDDALEDSVKNYQLLVRSVPGVEVFLVKLEGKDPSKIGFLGTHNLIRNSEEFTECDLLSYKLQM